MAVRVTRTLAEVAGTITSDVRVTRTMADVAGRTSQADIRLTRIRLQVLVKDSDIFVLSASNTIAASQSATDLRIIQRSASNTVTPNQVATDERFSFLESTNTLTFSHFLCLNAARAVPFFVKQSFNDKGIVNRNISRRINQSLYSLKRLWGGSFSIYSVGDATVNHLDGTQQEPATVVHIRRGIILPGKHIRDVKQTISMISANKSFVFGGSYDRTARTFIVDRGDAPTLNLTESDYIIYDGKRYEVKEFQEYEFDSAWIIAGQAIEGEVPRQIRLLSADNLIRLSQSANEVS
jgi:hypothetical protein